MKAVVSEEYGSPDVLRVEDVPQPVPAAGEVLIRVHAASVNDWDVGILRGAPFVNRLLFGLRRPKIRTLGCDVAGRVEAAGPGAVRFKPGDDVYGDLCASGWGAFAEYVCAPESALALKPAGMTFAQAAAIPQAAMLAVQALEYARPLRPGQEMLVNGAGGGVGTFAVQIAKKEGVSVAAVDSAEKLDLLRSLGAGRVVDYTREDFTRGSERYDVILDVKTMRSALDCVRPLRRGGLYVTVGGSMARFFQALLLLPWISFVLGKRLRLVTLKPNKDLALMNALFEAGAVVPVIDGTYSLEQVPDALRRFESGRHRGKVIVVVVPET